MKWSNSVLTLTSVLCITLVVRAQLPQPSPPVLTLDFPQYCVGDSWNLKLTSGVPNTTMRLLGTSNGLGWEIERWGATDAAGNFSAQGTFAGDAVGSHTLQLQIAGILSNNLSFAVSACSLKSRIAFASTRDGGRPAGFMSSPYVYVANVDGSDVMRLAQGSMPAWSPDGKKIVFSRAGEIRVINEDGTNEHRVGSGIYPSWSFDGTKIVFQGICCGAEGGIFTMNSDGSNVTRVISSEFANPGWGDYAVELPSWSPDGRSIAFVRANYEDPWTIHILDLITSEISFLRIGSSVNESRSVGDSRPVWSPDGTKLLLQVPFWTISSVNRNGSNFQTYVQGTYVGNPDWSPDGNSIVFEKFTGPPDQTSPVGSRMRIFVSNLKDGSVRQLIPDAVDPALVDYWDSQPAWSRIRR